MDKEIVAVVDEQGAVLEYVKRDRLKDDHRWKIISIWIEDGAGNVLIQQRSHKKRLGAGLWTPAVEGTVEKDDSFVLTAKREALEEIGLDDITLIPTKKVLYKSDFGSRLAQGYTAICKWPIERFVLQADEVAQLQWRPKQAVINEIKNGDPKYPRTSIIWLDMFNLV